MVEEFFIGDVPEVLKEEERILLEGRLNNKDIFITEYIRNRIGELRFGRN